MNDILPIRVVIVDDYDVVRKGLAFFLNNEPDIHVVGEARSGLEAITVCEHTCPQVILMDLRMPDLDGISAARLIHFRWPAIRIIALSGYLEKKLVEDVFQAGAIGYLLKNVSGEELVQAIHRALTGRPTLVPEAIRLLVEPGCGEARQPDHLSQRELEVLPLLAKGLNNREIAGRLGVSRSTVILRIKAILSKLGAVNRTEAVAIAIQYHLVG